MDLLKLVQRRGQTEDTGDTGAASRPGARHLDNAQFRQLVAESPLPVVVDFWAVWCGPCHMMAPAVDQLARDFADRVVVAKLDADLYPDIIEQYGIMGIPTLIFFKGGQEVDRVIGLTPYKPLRAALEELSAPASQTRE